MSLRRAPHSCGDRMTEGARLSLTDDTIKMKKRVRSSGRCGLHAEVCVFGGEGGQILLWTPTAPELDWNLLRATPEALKSELVLKVETGSKLKQEV